MDRAPSLEELLAALRGDDDDEKRRALSLIARHRMTGAADALRDILGSQASNEIRYLAGKVLNFLNASQPTPVRLAQSVVDPGPSGDPLRAKDSHTRLRAILKATEENDTDLLERLQEMCETEEDPFVRSALAVALARLDGKNSLGHIVRHFLDDPHPRVRANAVEALASLADLRGCPFLVKRLSDPDSRVRANAAVALQKFAPDNVWRILEAMATSAQVWMRDSAAYAIATMEDEKGMPLLERLLADTHEDVAAKARAGLEKLAAAGNQKADFILAKATRIPDVGSWESLIKLTEDARARGVAPRPEPPPAPPLEEQEQIAFYDVTNEDREVRLAEARRAAGEGGKGAAEALASRLGEEQDFDVILALIEGLGTLRAAKQADAIRPFFDHQDETLAATAVRALGDMQDESVYSCLIPLLKDRRPSVRAEACVALNTCEYADAMGTLLELAQANRKETALTALEAARRIGTPHVVPILAKLARDPRQPISERAIEVLREMASSGSKSAQRALIEGGIDL